MDFMFISVEEIRKRKATDSSLAHYGVTHSVMEQNVGELVGDGYFPIYLPESLEKLARGQRRQGLVDWLETNVVPIFSDLEAGKGGEFDRLEDRNKKLLAKWLEFAGLSGEESYWLYPNRSSGCDYIISYVGDLTDSVQLLDAYYSRRFADATAQRDRDGFRKYGLPPGGCECHTDSSFILCDFCDVLQEFRDRACRRALGSAWPEWLNFADVSMDEPLLDTLSATKRLCWSMMCFMVTVGIVGKTFESESLSSFARKVVHFYADLLLSEEDA